MHGWRAHVAPRIARRLARGRRALPGAPIALALVLAASGCGNSTHSRVSSTSPPAPVTGTAAHPATAGGASASESASAPSPVEQAPTATPTPTPAAAAETSVAKAASAACSAASRGVPAEARPTGSGETSRAVSAAQFASSYLLVTRRLDALSRLQAVGVEGVRLGRLETILRRLQSLYLRASRGGGTALPSAIARLERTATAAAIVAGTRACVPPRTAGGAGAASGLPASGNAAAPTVGTPSRRRHASPVRPAGEGQP